MTPGTNITGMKIAITAAVAAKAAKAISFVPREAASFGLVPSSMWRVIFSCTMIASSTTKPITSARPNSVKVFKVKPHTSSTVIVPNNDIGIAKMTLVVAERDPRNNQQTTAVSATASSSSWPRSVIERSMNTVAS